MGKYFTYSDRIKIELMLNRGVSVSEIALFLNHCKSAVYAEIKRGHYIKVDALWRDKKSYSADIAQKRHDFMQSSKGRNLKIGADRQLNDFIEDKIINDRYSPDVVADLIRHGSFSTTLCTKTIYNYIDSGLFINLTNKHLLIKSKRRKRTFKKVDRSHKHINIRSIEERPDIFDRVEFGHWEMDTVVGKRSGKNSCLLVLTERKTRFELIYKISAKNQISVVSALSKISKRFNTDIFKSVTMDNGSEFLCQSSIEYELNTLAFYCHPFSSWERGSNENQNKLIRRFIPKGRSIDLYSDSDVQHIANWINTFPRKILNYLTPAQLFECELSKMNIL